MRFLRKMDKRFLILPALVLLTVFTFTIVRAHGVIIEYSMKPVIEVFATFDSGEPMQNAQVNIFAPDDPQISWMSGTTDQNGRFTFSPDPTIPGTWDIQVRQAGHGGIVHINLEDGALNSNTTGFSRLQIVLMGACALWGFVGTALFFYRRGS